MSHPTYQKLFDLHQFGHHVLYKPIEVHCLDFCALLFLNSRKYLETPCPEVSSCRKLAVLAKQFCTSIGRTNSCPESLVLSIAKCLHTLASVPLTKGTKLNAQSQCFCLQQATDGSE
eukprot:5356148-Amphidinium_carterae.1